MAGLEGKLRSSSDIVESGSLAAFTLESISEWLESWNGWDDCVFCGFKEESMLSNPLLNFVGVSLACEIADTTYNNKESSTPKVIKKKRGNKKTRKNISIFSFSSVVVAVVFYYGTFNKYFYFSVVTAVA